ncbi:inhibin alpha chain [Plectropomus leopardus]|uniref:inhibin alpha chain n=1 Tax=Plectropomus leopardus TaxID=160734 RepID=UPI001C4AF193|nr:inhibin alpha chain [Plectropomus leopardus]
MKYFTPNSVKQLSYSTVTMSCALIILAPLWINVLTQTCRGEELSREAVLSWFRERLLEGLGLEEPPLTTVQGSNGDTAQPEARHAPRRAPRTSRTAWVNHQTSQTQEMSQIILFPSSDSSCTSTDSSPGDLSNSHFTYYFQPSVNNQETLVTSAHFWFFTGKETQTNSSAQLFAVTSTQKLLLVADAPSKTSSDGWTTYHLDQNLLAPVAEGPFLLQVRCPSCQCLNNEADKTPFLHLNAQPRGPVRSTRHAPLTIPWSPSAIDLLQRPPQNRPQLSDCNRAQIDISFEELGWDNWIVHPKVLTFYYCHGNCSAWDRPNAMLGITQCCAPVPGTMRSLRITTTSDGGYSFKYETLPNIIPEECTCI